MSSTKRRARLVAGTALPLALFLTGCTSGNPASQASEAPPTPTVSGSPVDQRPLDKGATCLPPDEGDGSLRWATLQVADQRLTVVVNVASRPWLAGKFGIQVDVKSPNEKYHYVVSAPFARSEAQPISVKDLRVPSTARVQGEPSVEGHSVTASVPLSQLEGISPSHLLWRASLTAGAESLGACPGRGSGTGAYSTFPEGSPTEASQADLTAAPLDERMSRYVSFSSPSGNIVCGMSRTDARCEVRDHAWEMPREPAGGCVFADFAAQMRVTDDEVEWGTCRSEMDRGSTVLPYGYSYSVGAFTCTSKSDGMHCLNADTDMGFWLSRTHHDSIGYTIDPDEGFILPKGPFTFAYAGNGATCHMDPDAGVVCTIEPVDWDRGPKKTRCPSPTHAVRHTLTADGSTTDDCVAMPADSGRTITSGSVILGDYRCDLNEFMSCRNEATGESIYVTSYLFSG